MGDRAESFVLQREAKEKGVSRYDIRPNLDNGWDVIDIRNGNGRVASFITRSKALAYAQDRERNMQTRSILQDITETIEKRRHI